MIYLQNLCKTYTLNGKHKVVADDITTVPHALTRSSSAGAGNPKWKLTTGGL